MLLMLESASKVNAANEKKERGQMKKERKREKIKGRTIRGFELNSTFLTQML